MDVCLKMAWKDVENVLQGLQHAGFWDEARVWDRVLTGMSRMVFADDEIIDLRTIDGRYALHAKVRDVE